MARSCPHCDYDMTGLPSDRCPECGKRYDPVLAMRRRAAAATDGVRFRDLILLLAFMAFGNASRWEETLGVAAVGAIWAWLRREALRRRPLALWLALLAILCAGNLNEAGQDAGAFVWLGVASVIVLVEMWRFGWRAPGAAMQAAGLISAIAAGITAVLAAFQMIAGGSPGSSFHIVAWDIPADTRTGCLMALLASLILLGCGILLWRAGLWVSALAGKPPPPARSIRLLFPGRGGREEDSR